MEQKETKTIMNQVYNAIFSDIIHNEFDFDEYLTEKALMEKYNVSRAPVREALMQLRSDHFYRLHSPSRIPHTQAGPAGAARYCKLPRCVWNAVSWNSIITPFTPEHIQSLREICRQYADKTGQELY